MTTDVDSPTGNKDADSPNATPEVRQSTGAHDVAPGAVLIDGTAAATLADAPGDGVVTAAADGLIPAPAGAREVVPTGPDAEGETYFRFPAADDPDPGWPRLLGMSLFAAILGLAGVGVGVRGLAAAIGSSTPGWYVPLLAGAGLLSVGLTVAAFLSIHRHLLPWMLLLAAAVPLGTAVILAVAY